ncbi:hypothetical protein M8C21_013850 [Ambrosia artemisiifolia]|uniref:Uncharacterized protein n=1 Tax=Ambrosia artemisiifolia TaxID=4212 RepID=A0AAD5D7S9_AMBAR|nr:hypothetical protein M8C21_026370 [Ambrosia artemisiifolia]KAI7754725.1 hypothetical protein M8C21_013850 [Ambrosia artemisiifolia]
MMSNGQIHQSLDGDQRLKFKSRFHDRAEGDYSQRPLVSDGDESELVRCGSIDMKLYTGGSWKMHGPGNTVYSSYKEKGSDPFFLTYKRPMLVNDDPAVTFLPISINNDQDLKVHFLDHVKEQLASGKPIKLYHAVL